MRMCATLLITVVMILGDHLALNSAVTEVPKNVSPSKNPSTTVTCKGELNFEYEKNKATFHQDVVVEDPRMKMTADNMTAYFIPKTKEINKIIAVGNVRFKKEEKSAKSEKAVYTAQDGKVVLTGHPLVKNGESIMSGEKITFFRDNNRMLIEPSAKLVLYSSDQKDVNNDWLK